MLTRDQMIREARSRKGNWPGLLMVYGVLVGTLAWTASVIV